MLPQKAEPYKEATLPIAGNKNRATAEDMKTFGHPEGPSMQMDPESGTVKIITKKESFTFGSSFDVGNSKVFGNFGNFVNWLTMPNPIRKCMQILIPDALPFKPLTFEPFPNVPNITLAYQQIKNFTENMILLKGVADEVKKQRQQTT